MSDDQSANIAHHLLAHGEVTRLQSYLERGRVYGALSIEDLQHRYVEAFRNWIANLSDRDSQRPVDDIGTEFEMRGLAPPNDLVRPELQILQETVQARYEALSDEEKADINEQMVSEYLEITHSEN